MALSVNQFQAPEPHSVYSENRRLEASDKKEIAERMKEIDSAIQGFCQYLHTKNMASNTIHVYSYALRQFLCRYRQVDFSNLHLYKVFLLEHYKPQTVNLRIRALNSYLEFTRAKSQKLSMVKIQ